MSLPKHPREIEPARQALAPYNFVELPDQIVSIDPESLPDQGRFYSDRFTGEFACEMITASPLYIRAGLSPKDFEAGFEAKDQPDFFYTRSDGDPVVPGSSLRGMIRSLVEVVSFSKLSAVTDLALAFRAVGEERYRAYLMHEDAKNTFTPLFRAGYLVKDGSDWYIHPAVEINGVTWARIRSDPELFGKLKSYGRCQNASVIYVSVSQPQYQPIRGFISMYYSSVIQSSDRPGLGLTEMVLTKSGFMASKRSEAVIFPVDPNRRIQLTDEQIEQYRDQLTPAQRQLLGSAGALIEGKKGEPPAMQPVFYLTRPGQPDRVHFFGHCRLFRIPYPKTPLGMLPSELRERQLFDRKTGRAPDKDTKEEDKYLAVDLAEAVFGYSYGDDERRKEKMSAKERAYAGRVSFTDAHLQPDQKDLWLSERPTTLKILSGPKPTTFQHYLVQPEPGKYVIGRTKDGKPKTELRLKDYTSPPTQTTLRGHKFYWHKGDVTRQEIAEQVKVAVDDTQHTQVRPLCSGVRFAFTIRFENLSLAELGALQWVLNIGSDEKVRFKLGMGKPLGMGAVAIKARLRLLDQVNRYQKLLDGPAWAEGWLEDAKVEKKAGQPAQDFERLIVQSLGYTAETRLTQLERIRQMLMLLSWPGPDPTYTRYMEIEHYNSQGGRVNEYKERLVLPSPKEVWRKKRST